MLWWQGTAAPLLPAERAHADRTLRALESLSLLSVPSPVDLLRRIQRFPALQATRQFGWSTYTADEKRLMLGILRASAASVHDPCTTCDNCTRDPATYAEHDVTLPAWQILRVAEEIKDRGVSITIKKLAEIARGLGGGTVSSGTKRKKGRSASGPETIDIEDVAGGKVDMKQEVGWARWYVASTYFH